MYQNKSEEDFKYLVDLFIDINKKIEKYELIREGIKEIIREEKEIDDEIFNVPSLLARMPVTKIIKKLNDLL